MFGNGIGFTGTNVGRAEEMAKPQHLVGIQAVLALLKAVVHLVEIVIIARFSCDLTSTQTREMFPEPQKGHGCLSQSRVSHQRAEDRAV